MRNLEFMLIVFRDLTLFLALALDVGLGLEGERDLIGYVRSFRFNQRVMYAAKSMRK